MAELRRIVALEDVRSVLARPRSIELATSVSPEMFFQLLAGRETVGSTLFVDEQPIAVGGVTKLAAPYCFVWLIASVDLKDYAMTVIREMKATFNALLDAGNVLCTNVTPGEVVAERFARYLGFKQHPDKFWELKR